MRPGAELLVECHPWWSSLLKAAAPPPSLGSKVVPPGGIKPCHPCQPPLLATPASTHPKPKRAAARLRSSSQGRRGAGGPQFRGRQRRSHQ